MSAVKCATARACAGVLATMQACAAFGAALSVEPLRLELEPGSRTAAITVRNDGAAPVVVQARVLAWSQPGGKDALADTREMLITPAVAEIPAQGFQVLRIGRRSPAHLAPAEQTFRVLIKEVLPEAVPGPTGVRMAMELSLPVFVGAPTLGTAHLEWTAVREADALRLTARNAGARRARVSGAALHDADGRLLGRWQGVTYLLAGATRSFRFPSDATIEAGGDVTLVLTTDGGTEEVHATLAGMGN